ncbi:MAG: DUF4301 domain-containing protein [Bacteroidetes bacterium HGW-Bacteroidetes-2]|jgi:hypothetical protein|nr:MAG: DUF4301 domain-containing protein [Bacteroidetes bacterium HGW-Bacteroidetes-2]
MKKFTKKETQQIEAHGLTLSQVERQLHLFEEGIPFSQVITAATHNNGIEVLNSFEEEKLIALYEKEKDALIIMKFVPASGAATRMFQSLHRFLEEFNPEEDSLKAFLKLPDSDDIKLFVKGLTHFPFIKILRKKIQKLYPEFKFYTKEKRTYLLIKTLLEKEGLNYNNLPKGLLIFHKYTKNTATAFEEQLLETAYYASVKNQCYLHFTFSEEHVDGFKKEFDRVQNKLERKTKCKFHISYSFQKVSTDTISVTLQNAVFKDKNHNLHFRPSGHGALIENLNEIDADIIFIKNIDNVVVEKAIEDIAKHKKILAGKLLQLQHKTFKYLKLLDKPEVSPEILKEIKGFLMSELNIKNPPSVADEIYRILNKPIRVCGMVQNTGAPGGGPFWVKDKKESITLQIIEMSQIDISNAHQKNLLQEATHFNPVDLVCGVRNYKGEKFDLKKFVNPDTGFISKKSYQGKAIKALELPGLWNGAMAGWNTIFIEVPLYTFNPVKTVIDLLKESHQNI